MKRMLLCIVIALLLPVVGTYGQTAASYGYSVLPGTFTDISGTGTAIVQPGTGTPLGAPGIDITVQNIPIGFTFYFCGAPYMQLSACNHGWVSLANSASTVATNAAANIPGPGFLMAFWDDLRGTGVNHYYQTSGLAPNRVFTIQYSDVIAYTVSGISPATFQVKLYESTGNIDYCYGLATLHSAAASIGIANSATDYNSVLPGFATSGSTSFNAGIGAPPADGVVLRWSPPCVVTVAAANSGPVCAGGTLTLTGTTSGTGYTWTGPGGYTSTLLSPVIAGITAAMAGTYTLAVTNGTCTNTATTTVTVNDVPPVTGTLSVCPGQTTALSNAAAGGTWSSSNVAIATVGSSSGIVTGIAAGTVNISYIAGVCPAGAVVTVTPVPNAGGISGFPTLCISVGTRLHETAAGGRWSSGNSSVATIDSVTGVASTVGAGTTVITYTVGTGACSNMAFFTMTVVSPTFTVSKTVSDIKCIGDSNGSIALAVIGGKAPFTYRWSTGASTPVITGLGAGSYIYTVREDSSLCSRTDTVQITNPDSLLVAVDSTSDYCKSGSGRIKVKVTGGTAPYHYQWSIPNIWGTAADEIDSLTVGTYSVSITDATGCGINVVTTVRDECWSVLVAEGMSPNGDGLNDTWEISGLDPYPANTVQVFDKWGSLVYEQTDYKSDWKGMGKNGSLVPDGNYYFLVKLNAPNLSGGGGTFTGPLLIKR